MLWGLPPIWPLYKKSYYPFWTKYLFPIVQISLMSSVYCTIVMSWERYVRICLVNSYSLYFGDRKFCLYIVLIFIFPIIFYIPKFFEVSTYIDTTSVEYKYNFKINHIYRKLQALLGSALVSKGCNFLPPCTYKAIPYCF